MWASSHNGDTRRARARLRADARGRDGGVREESVQGVKGVGRPSDVSIQNISGLPKDMPVLFAVG